MVDAMRCRVINPAYACIKHYGLVRVLARDCVAVQVLALASYGKASYVLGTSPIELVRLSL